MIDDFDALLGAAKRGESVAIGALWQSLNNALVRFLRARVGDAAEDVASETWMSAAQHLRKFDGGEIQFRAWLFTIARRRAIDFQRRRQARPRASGDVGAVGALADTHDTATEALDRMSTDTAVTVIARLPVDQAEVILLRVVAGLDVARVAAIVNKRPGTVRMLQHRGLQRLRALLEAARTGEGVTR